ncbi:MAG: hypothetical protein N2Z73_01755 [Endomicrobia bacterium]|nr:hypothetical protein [Endomicrobiia bacterium]
MCIFTNWINKTKVQISNYRFIIFIILFFVSILKTHCLTREIKIKVVASQESTARYIANCNIVKQTGATLFVSHGEQILPTNIKFVGLVDKKRLP